jgi:CubicO group peptidase (beta-lactamase class C family)
MGDLVLGMNIVNELLENAVKSHIGSGIAAAWGDLNKREAHTLYVGKESSAPDAGNVDASTQFDLASLTKILATTSLYMKWVDQGKIKLEDAFPGHHHSFTLAQILSHSSGLIWWKPFYESMIAHFGKADQMIKVPIEERKKYFYEQVFAAAKEPLQTKPGAKIVYSDLGFLLLSHFAEVISKKSFD